MKITCLITSIDILGDEFKLKGAFAMERIWAVIKSDQKITGSYDTDCAIRFWQQPDDLSAVMDALCLSLDIAHPVWLNKHSREMDAFSRTVFFGDDFMEPIFFDSLELEYITEK